MLDYPSSNKEENLIDKITSLFQSEPENVEELTEIIQNASNNNVINKDTLNMIEGIFELSKLRVRDIMVPRSSMVSVLINDPIETILNKVVTAGHSRYPVLSEDQEHIDGLLLAKDLLTIENNTNEFKIEKILRPIMVVPESKRLDFLLKDFQKKRYHLAVVIDEFGSYSGVGTIGDEYDENPENNADIREAGKDLYLVNGMTSIVDFNEYFNVNIDNNEVETVAGIVISQLGHIPRVGEQTKVQKFEFKVLSVDKRRINTLQVKVDSDEETEPQEEESGNYE